MITFIKSRVYAEKLNVRQPYLLLGKKQSTSIQEKKKKKAERYRGRLQSDAEQHTLKILI